MNLLDSILLGRTAVLSHEQAVAAEKRNGKKRNNFGQRAVDTAHKKQVNHTSDRPV